MRRPKHLPACGGGLIVLIISASGCVRELPDASEGWDLRKRSDLGSIEPASPSPDLGAGDLASSSTDLADPPDLETGLGGCDATDREVPSELRCTGLYGNWPLQTIAVDVQAYTPGFQLWTDGAKKARWVRLPPGTRIDASEANEWRFPVGTKLWKEFTVPVGGVEKKVETRMLWKISATGVGASDWVHTTYRWSEDQTQAFRVRAGVAVVPGTASKLPIPGSSTAPYPGYEIPSEAQCVQCHGGRKDFVLGFEAVLLAAPEASGLTYATLQLRGLLEGAKQDVPASALQIPGAPEERAALGRLHANCGVCCHNGNQMPSPSALHMRVDYSDGLGGTPSKALLTSTAMTAINVPASNTAVLPPGVSFDRLRPTDPTRSAIPYREAQRGTPAQMPPVGTHANSDELTKTLTIWIEYMTSEHGYPPPAP